MRTNVHFASLSSVRPQVYAKDPEFTVQPAAGVPQEQLNAVRGFGEAAEAVLTEYLVNRANLKRRSKRILTSVFCNAIGRTTWRHLRGRKPSSTTRPRATTSS
jgi:hypothetical protein